MDMATIYNVVKYASAFWILVMILVAMISLGGKDSDRYERKSRYFLMLSLVCFMPTVQYFSSETLPRFGRYSLGFPWLNYGGLACVLLGLLVQIGSIFTLKRAWSPNVTFNADHALVKKGIYRYLRHPIYAAVLLQILGFCLALSNWTSFIALLVPNLAAFLYRMKVEEAALVEVFGDEYRDYMKTAKRFIPWIL